MSTERVNDIRAAFFDVDGTLVSFRSHTVPESAVAALKRLRAGGVRIIIATGRAASNLDPIGMIPYDGVVALNGTHITMSDDTLVARHSIARDKFERFLELAERHGVAASVEGDDGIFVSRMTQRVEAMSRLVGMPLPEVADLRCRFVEGVTSQLCLYADVATERRIMARLPGLVSSRWCDPVADVNLADVDKGTALLETARHLGITPAQTIAFGDGGNDIPMLRAAGIGVAMGNARPEVKASADWTTASVDDDGIAAALACFGLI